MRPKLLLSAADNAWAESPKRLNQGNTLELRFAKIVQTNCNTKRKSINRYAMSQKNCQTL